MFVATIALFLGINAYTPACGARRPDELLDSLFPNDPDDFVRIVRHGLAVQGHRHAGS